MGVWTSNSLVPLGQVHSVALLIRLGQIFLTLPEAKAKDQGSTVEILR
jgi:hypothetical protein